MKKLRQKFERFCYRHQNIGIADDYVEHQIWNADVLMAVAKMKNILSKYLTTTKTT